MEIKFRVWDKEKNRYEQACVNLAINALGTEVYWLFGGEAKFMGGRDRFDVEFFINRQDNKGVDLYDGDIVQTFETRWNDDFNDTELVKDRIDVVGNTDPHLWLKNESFGYEREDLDEPDEVEIIGNRWQNPELLNA